MRLHVEIGKERLVTDDIHGGQENNGDVVKARIRADALHHIQPVHDGHMIIEDDGIEGKAERCRLLQHGDAGRPVFHRMAVYAPASQLLRQYTAIDIVIVDHEHTDIVDRHGKKRKLALPLDHLKRNIDLEGRSLADAADDIDRAIKQTDEADRDRQPQSRSFVPTRRGAINLAELVKDGFELVCRNADAAVFDAQ
ncbi:hypothetical protein D3C86_1582660 [compost metagenome]